MGQLQAALLVCKSYVVGYQGIIEMLIFASFLVKK